MAADPSPVGDGRPAAPAAPSAYRHWIEDHVRYADLDPVGHCNNAAIGVFFESARVALFEDIKAAGAVGEGLSLVVVRVAIDFRRELHYRARVRIGTRVVGLGRTSMTLGSGVFEGETCAAEANVVALLFDLAARRPVVLPGSLREALSAFA